MKKVALIFKKTIFLSVALFLFFVITNSVKAAEINYDSEFSKKCSLRNCNVPIPTLDKPNNQSLYFDEKFYITGLTWNNTEVDIYVDGKYKGSAAVVNDENSDTANFYYLVKDKSLFEGSHNWEAIAWSKNGRDRSFVSQENKFEIKLKSSPVVNSIPDTKVPEVILEQTETTPVTTGNINSIDSKDATVTITTDEAQGNVAVDTATSSEGNVNIIESREIDKNISAISEKQEVKTEDTEAIQPATPDDSSKDIIKDDLDLQSDQTRNKKLGIFLLFALVVIVIFSVVVTKKKKD